MKKVSQLLITVLFSLAVLFTLTIPAFAASTPAQVKNLKVTSAAYDSLKLTWSKASDSNKYYIEVYNTSTKKWKAVSNTKNTSYTVTKLTTGTSYKYRVRGYKNLTRKYGAWSAAVSGTPKPAKVTDLKASSTTPVSTKLTWAKVAGATGYYVFNGTKKIATVKTNSYSVTKLTPNTSVSFTVQAYRTVSKKDIAGDKSAALKVSTTVAKVSGLKAAETTPVSTKLTWTKVTGATGYYVFDDGKKIATIKSNTASYTASAITPNATHKFTVQAYVTVSSKTYTGAKSSELKVATTIAKVSGLKAAETTPVSTKLTWTKVTGATGYYVFDGTTKIGTIKSNTASYTATKLTSNATHKFTVQAYVTLSSKTYTGAKSSELSVKTTVTAPSKLKASSIANTSLKLSWTKSSGVIEGYNIYNGSTLVATVATGTTSYTVKSLSAAKKYTFKVEAYYGSAKSSQASVSVTTACSAPSGVAVGEVKTTSVALSWNAVAGAEKYAIYNGSAKVLEVSETSAIVPSLKAATSYSFTVKAIHTKNGSALEGKASTAVSATTPNVDITGDTINIGPIYPTGQQYSMAWSFVGTYGQYGYVITDSKVEGSIPLTYSSQYKFTGTPDAFDVNAEEAGGYTTISWAPVKDAVKYDVYAIKTNDISDFSNNYRNWILLDTTKDTSSKVVLAADTDYSIKVVAYDRLISLTAYKVANRDTGELETTPYSGTRLIPAQYSTSKFATIKTAPMSSFSGNMANTKTILSVIQAVNSTKARNDEVSIKVDNTMKAELTKASGKFGIFNFNNLKTMFAVIKTITGEDIAGDIEKDMSEDEHYTVDFVNGTGDYVDPSTNKTVVVSLFNFILPSGQNALLYKANDIDTLSSRITNIASTPEANGNTKVSFRITQEKLDAKGGGTPVHDSILDSFASQVGSLDELGSDAKVSLGATDVFAVIRPDGTLASYTVKSPFAFDMSMEEKESDLSIKMTLAGTMDYNYVLTWK